MYVHALLSLFSFSYRFSPPPQTGARQLGESGPVWLRARGHARDEAAGPGAWGLLLGWQLFIDSMQQKLFEHLPETRVPTCT